MRRSSPRFEPLEQIRDRRCFRGGFKLANDTAKGAFEALGAGLQCAEAVACPAALVMCLSVFAV
jgi:hypothetical protein